MIRLLSIHYKIVFSIIDWKSQIGKSKYSASVENRSSDDTDTEENSQEDVVQDSRKKARYMNYFTVISMVKRK